MRGQPPARRCQLSSPGRPVQQRRPGLPLQRGKLLGDSRCRVAESSRRRGDRAALGELKQQPKPVSIEHSSSISPAYAQRQTWSAMLMLYPGMAGHGSVPGSLAAEDRQLAPAARSFAMPWAGPATLTEPTVFARSRRHCPAQHPARAQHRCRWRLRTRAAACQCRPRSPPTRRSNPGAAGGQSVLPLAFGESGLPVHPLLTAELADTAGRGAYGPVAGTERLREAAAGYWSRRSLPTDPARSSRALVARRCCSARSSRWAPTSPCRDPAG